MRKEEEMKKKLRMEKMKSQKEEEDRIRANLLIEEKTSLNSLKESGYVSISTKTVTRNRPLSMPSALLVSYSLYNQKPNLNNSSFSHHKTQKNTMQSNSIQLNHLVCIVSLQEEQKVSQ